MIQTLLLAAGFSRRFGEDKLMHVLANGERLIQQTLERLVPVSEQLCVIVRPTQTGLQRWLEQQHISMCLCPTAEHGLGHSIACGVGSSSHADGWLIALADMPYIQTSTYSAVLDGLRQGHPICRPSYQGHHGHPVGFDKRYRDRLLQLSGDQGARNLLQTNRLQIIDVDDEGCILDIDRPEAVQG